MNWNIKGITQSEKVLTNFNHYLRATFEYNFHTVFTRNKHTDWKNWNNLSVHSFALTQFYVLWLLCLRTNRVVHFIRQTGQMEYKLSSCLKQRRPPNCNLFKACTFARSNFLFERLFNYSPSRSRAERESERKLCNAMARYPFVETTPA